MPPMLRFENFNHDMTEEPLLEAALESTSPSKANLHFRLQSDVRKSVMKFFPNLINRYLVVIRPH